ncbi:hypothetical protein ACHAWX_001486 [Stephanocyclus meneghinianus]
MNEPAHPNGAPQAALPSEPQGYTIDVRLFLAVITTTMAIAFTAGVMLGPTDPALVGPVLSLMGISIDVPLPLADIRAGRDANYPAPQFASMAGGYGRDASLSTGGSASSSSKKAKAMEITSSGESVLHDEEGNVILRQPRRLPTDHVATLGYKIKETHVNIDTPVLEGQGTNVPYDREVTYDSLNRTKEGTLLRDQSTPSGQHLLVDIKNVEAAFLNSESRLATAMQDAVTAAGLTMLSYHCHSLHPAGVSCVGVLLESHISFHTWPDEGVITLDLFTTSQKPLLPALPAIEELFGVPRVNPLTGEKEECVTLWSHELRGFRTEDERKRHYLDDGSDLSNWITSPLEVVYKKQIVGRQTLAGQRIDVWDAKEREDMPSFKDGLKGGWGVDDPRWLSNEHATPQRLLFINGALMSQSESERELHESLVQPAMFAHPAPKNVAILGGGEGASLREVLRHKTVEKVTMVELDQEMVEIAKEHMPAMSNCTDIVGSANDCFDDERTDLIFGNAFTYVVENAESSNFDVMIVDLLDPKNHAELTDANVVNAMVSSLLPNGVMSMQIGVAPSIHDPRADMGMFRERELLINHLEANPDVAAIFVYEEAHCGRWEPNSFLVACRDVSCRKQWYAETDEVDYQIYERIGGTKSGEPSLIHFDGATQRSFQMPPRAWETIYCRREPEPFECAYRGLDLDKELFEYYPDDDDASAFEVRPMDGDETSAVFAKVDIPEGSYIMPTHLAASFEVSDDSMTNIRGVLQTEGVEKATVIEDFVEFIDTHGHPSLQVGSGKNYVEIGGSFLMRTTEDRKLSNVRRWVPPHPQGGRPKYSPVYDRHRHSFDVFLVASRDIKAGEEVMKPIGLWD